MREDMQKVYASAMLHSYRNQSIDWQCESVDWFFMMRTFAPNESTRVLQYLLETFVLLFAVEH